jgi:murein DD-endopeptidase MepM/ murein hydrolase activator NlpD
LSGAFDIGNFISGFFPGRGEKIGNQSSQSKPQPKPQIRGGKLRLGGIRALGIANAVFAGLDFATGLAEGESIGKSAAGVGGSLAGSLLGGAIGQALIPVPGLGFVLGSMAGGFLGGYTADRAYESVTGSLGQSQEQKIKEQEQKQKSAIARRDSSSKGSQLLSEVINRFSIAVLSFENFVRGVSGMMGSEYTDGETIQEYGDYPDRDSGNFEPGQLPELEAEGGILPSGKMNSGYRTSRRPNHMGTDYAMPTGTPISVIIPGKVTRAGWFDGYGYGVQVNHPGGINSFYGHLSSINVKVGQNIEPGTVIGNVGSTGRSTGPHLHFEVDANGKSKVDPTNYADKIFRFGGNVRAKPKASSPQKSEQQASAQKLEQPKSSLDPSKALAQAPKQTQNNTLATTSPNIVESSLVSKSPPESTSVAKPSPRTQVLPKNVMAAPTKETPKIQAYPSYSQGQSYIMEKQTIISSGGDSSSGSNRSPIVVPMGGGGGSGLNPIVQINGTHVLNNFMKTVLLTSLSSA